MDTERLIQTLRNVLRAKDREEEEFRRCNGFDWGYHGFQFTEASREAAEKFEAALNGVVVEAVGSITCNARRIFVERLENMQKNQDHWLTVTAVLALLYDCEMEALRELTEVEDGI
jgi:hypothetical protein